MRITFVAATADRSGGFRVITTFARHMRDRGHTVLVVTQPWPKPSLRNKLRAKLAGQPPPLNPGEVPSHLEGTNLPHKTLESSRPVTAADLPDADVVIATWWESAEWVQALPRSKGAKLHLFQDYEVWGGPDTVARVDAVCALPIPKITATRWVTDLLRDRFNQHDVTRIPNSVDFQTFDAPPRGRQTRPTVGLLYTSFRNKGTDVSVRAFEIAKRTLPDLQLVAFGHEEPPPELPLPAGATYHLRVPESALKSIYASCDAWLFGTRKEGFGLPILEAMACRTPVIGTPAGAAPDLLAGGGGILVPLEDPEAMAAAIVKVCTMPDPEWRALSDRAYASARSYSWKDAADDFEAVLARVARERKPEDSNASD